LIAISALILPHPARADIMGSIISLVNYVVMAIDMLLGAIFALLIEVLIFVSQYNNFTNEPAIATAWVLLRDIANMGFVVIIVVIGFAQMFDLSKIPKIQNMRLGIFLPKLVIGVLLINFSKGIVGLLIDLSQIITLTFVAAFKDVAASNLIGGLQLGKIYAAGASSGEQLNMFFLLMMIMIIMAIAIIIVAMITALFVTRIVAFWLLTVFSPVMFAASVYPVSKLQGYYHEWWKKFGGYLIMGPSLAFMVWLAFLILQNTSSIGVIGAKPTAMAEPTVAGQYVANAQVSTDSTEYKNIKASSSNPTQSPIPGLDFTTLLGFVMGAGALVSTIFVAQMSKVVGSKEIGGAAMGALKKTGSYAAAGVGRAGAMARGATLGGASAGFKKLAGQENIYEKGKAGEKMDAQGYKLDASGKKIVTGTRTRDNFFGQLSTQSGIIAEKGFIKTGQDKAKNIKDRWQSKGKIRKSSEKAMEAFNKGEAGFFKSIYAQSSKAGLEKSAAGKEAEKKRKDDFEKDAVDMKNQKKGLEAKSHQQASTLVAGAKTSGEKAAIATGVINNKELWEKLSDEQKKYWFQELDKHRKNFDSKIVAADLNMAKILNQDLLTPEEKEKLMKDLKPAQTLNAITSQINKASKNIENGEEVELNQKAIDKLKDAAHNLFEQKDAAGKALVNSKLRYEFLDKTMRREHYTDENNNVDEKKVAEELNYLNAKDKDALYRKVFTRGNPKEKEEQLKEFNRHNGGIFTESNEAERQAEAARENKLQSEATEKVKTSLGAAPDDAAKIKIVKDGLENGTDVETRAYINETKVNIFNEGAMTSDFNKLDARTLPDVVEHILSQSDLGKRQIVAISNKLAQRETASVPESIEKGQDLMRLVSINRAQIAKMSTEDAKSYQAHITSLLQEGKIVLDGKTNDGLTEKINALPEAQRKLFTDFADEWRGNLKQGVKQASEKLAKSNAQKKRNTSQ